MAAPGAITPSPGTARAALAEQQAGWYAYADAVRGVLEGGNPCGA